ncbi:hypothetical protein IQ266_04510 [filamentous cyanobacterium LEGE 11480]|uniref:Lipoprotein n=1 Tax=Romeriopsis navalis LEGE 11480 TaxID=2777977 RepID=A0A928VI39_9CYAN|nr:hypothetical protein [Romeriopsis navalis]MBE9029023.1 hypothetical protein [Romeriopsis navalis LEGE 11480]
MKRQYKVASVALFSLAMLSTGCSTRVAQCNKLIKVANAATTEVQSISQRSKLNKNKLQSMTQLADSLDKHIQEVQAVSLEDQTLQKFQSSLKSLYKSSSILSRTIVKAANAKDVKGMTSLLKQLAGQSQTERTIVNGINNYCQAGARGA